MRRLGLVVVLAAAMLLGCGTPDYQLGATVTSIDGPDLDLTYQGQAVQRRSNPDGSVTWEIGEPFSSYAARAAAVRDVVVSRAGVELTRIHLISSFCHPAKTGGNPTGDSYQVLLHADGRFCLSLQRCQFASAVSELPMLCN